MLCRSCEAVIVNGVICHETGCPDAWKDTVRKCAFCGCDFKPDEQYQLCCSDECRSGCLAITAYRMNL